MCNQREVDSKSVDSKMRRALIVIGKEASHLYPGVTDVAATSTPSHKTAPSDICPGSHSASSRPSLLLTINNPCGRVSVLRVRSETALTKYVHDSLCLETSKGVEVCPAETEPGSAWP